VTGRRRDSHQAAQGAENRKCFPELSGGLAALQIHQKSNAHTGSGRELILTQSLSHACFTDDIAQLVGSHD